MSTANEVSKTGNYLHTNYDVSKIFVWNNRYENGTFLNAGGAAASFAPGTVLGRIATSGKIVPLTSAATDGSQIPVGILLTEIVSLAAAGEKTINFCIAGDVVESKLIFDGSDTVETIVDDRRLKDRIAADTMGIKLVDSFELTGFDNQ